MTAMQHMPGLHGPNTPREELVRVLSQPMMTDAEAAARGGLPADAITPARLLHELGDAEALPLLVDILKHEPEPVPTSPRLVLRPNTIRTIAALTGPRAVLPLKQLYDVHLSLELGLIDALAQNGAHVPVHYDRLVDEIQPADITAVSARVPTVKAALQGFWAQLADTYLRDDPSALGLLALTAWEVRFYVAEALSNEPDESARAFFHHAFEQERCNFVLRAAAISLARRGDDRAIRLVNEHVRMAPPDYRSNPLDAIRTPPHVGSPSQLRQMVYLLVERPDEDEYSTATLRTVYDRIAHDRSERQLRDVLAARLGVKRKGLFRRV